ncbi:MAG: hypothetical protein KKF68_02875 [Nanoarchaeota archaeon]|nr:hypothetical protein [Nanoarchaeota archaeon]
MAKYNEKTDKEDSGRNYSKTKKVGLAGAGLAALLVAGSGCNKTNHLEYMTYERKMTSTFEAEGHRKPNLNYSDVKLFLEGKGAEKLTQGLKEGKYTILINKDEEGNCSAAVLDLKEDVFEIVPPKKEYVLPKGSTWSKYEWEKLSPAEKNMLLEFAERGDISTVKVDVEVDAGEKDKGHTLRDVGFGLVKKGYTLNSQRGPALYDKKENKLIRNLNHVLVYTKKGVKQGVVMPWWIQDRGGDRDGRGSGKGPSPSGRTGSGRTGGGGGHSGIN